MTKIIEGVLSNSRFVFSPCQGGRSKLPFLFSAGKGGYVTPEMTKLDRRRDVAAAETVPDCKKNFIHEQYIVEHYRSQKLNKQERE
jgi:hypothetical protein